MKDYKPMKQRMRATFAAGGTEEPRLTGVDREGEKLLGVQITLEGEALGHGVWLDRQFCADVVEQGNAAGAAGVKVRFGHPAMCSDALGTYLGRAKNFRLAEMKRKDGTECAGVIADIELAAEAHKSPNGDLAAWVMDTAENSPDTFGQSIVFTYSDFKYLDADGVWHLYSEEGADPDKSADGRVYAVLGRLHGTDFTDTPAATDGVFSSGDLAAEASDMLDMHPEIRKVIEASPKNAVEFLKRSGLFDALAGEIENARVSGLQKREAEIAAAHAEEVEGLKAELAKRENDIADLKGALLAMAENLDAKDKGLTEAKASVDALTAELAKANESLGTVRADLEAERERLRIQTGPALGRPEEEPLDGETAREHLANLPISQRAEYYRRHKNEIDNE